MSGKPRSSGKKSLVNTLDVSGNREYASITRHNYQVARKTYRKFQIFSTFLGFGGMLLMGVFMFASMFKDRMLIRYAHPLSLFSWQKFCVLSNTVRDCSLLNFFLCVCVWKKIVLGQHLFWLSCSRSFITCPTTFIPTNTQKKTLCFPFGPGLGVLAYLFGLWSFVGLSTGTLSPLHSKLSGIFFSHGTRFRE